MFIQLLSAQALHAITAYTATSVCIGGRDFEHSIICGTDLAPQWWQPTTLAHITALDIDALLINRPQLILLGTGEYGQLLPDELCAPLYARGIALETMNTGAACRTYNILINEGRRVTIGLLFDPVNNDFHG